MAQLYSVKEGKIVEWKLSVDQDGEIVANYKDQFLKFPAGLTKSQLQKAFKTHNTKNAGIVALTEEEIEASSKVSLASQKLIDSL